MRKIDKLIGSTNMLKFNAASNQYFEIPVSNRFNFGTSDFCISVICSNWTEGIIFQAIGDNGTNVYFQFGNANSLNVVAKSDTGIQLTLQGLNLPNLEINIVRISLIRNGTSIEAWINTKLAGTGIINSLEQFNLSHSSVGIQVGKGWIGNHSSIALSNLVFFRKALTYNELSKLHKTNVIPSSCHSLLVAHFPLNQNYGNKAWDVVEQYNYSKPIPLTAIHGNLLNYTNDEMGITNPLLNTAWQRIGVKKKEGNNLLKMNGVSGYAEISSYSPNPVAWSFYLEVDQQSFSTSVGALFCATNGNRELAIFLYNNENIRCYYNFLEVFNQAILPSGRRKIIYVYDGAIFSCSVNGINTGFNIAPNIVFEFFRFFRHNSADYLYSNQGIARSIFFDKFLSVREQNLVNNATISNEYKKISNIQFDLDFGDVFENGGNYFVRDNSGNARHAQLFNFNPTTDQPLRIEQSTRLPERTKALKLNGVNQYLSIANFNPTKEKGYTHIIGFKAVSDIAGYNQGLISKENGVLKLFWLPGGLSQIAGGFQTQAVMNFKTLSSINFGVMTEQANGIVANYVNGNLVEYGLPGDFLGWGEIVANLELGGRTGAGQYFNGHLFHISIWKGVLTQAQIINILNNGLAGNANSNLMTNCQLYLNFEEIFTIPPLLDLPSITSDPIVNAGTPIITYGTDGDGDYMQFEFSGYAPTESIYFTNLPGYITQVEARYSIEYKVISPTIFMIVYTTYNSTAIYTNGGNNIQTLVVTNTPSNPTVSFQYQSAYSVVGETIRIYSIKVELTNPYKIKDWSLQNRDVVLNNYTHAEITSGDALCKLVDIDALR